MAQSPLIWSTDAQGRVDFVSGGVLSLLGLRKSEVIGQPLSQLCHHIDGIQTDTHHGVMWEGTVSWAKTAESFYVCTCPVWNDDRTAVVGTRFIAPCEMSVVFEGKKPFSLSRLVAVGGVSFVGWTVAIVAASQHNLILGAATGILGCVTMALFGRRFLNQYTSFMEKVSVAVGSAPSHSKTAHLHSFMKIVEENKRTREFEKLRHTEENSTPLFNASHPCVVADENLNILSFNRSFSETFGQGKQDIELEGEPLQVFVPRLTSVPLSPIDFDWETAGLVYSTKVCPFFNGSELSHVQIEWCDVTAQRKAEKETLSHISSLHTNLSARLPHSDIAFFDVLGKNLNTLSSTFLESVRECALMIGENISSNGVHKEVFGVGDLQEIVGDKIDNHLFSKEQMGVLHGLLSKQNKKLNSFIEHQTRVFSSMEKTSVRCQEIGLGLCEKNVYLLGETNKSLNDIRTLSSWNSGERAALDESETKASQALKILGHVQKAMEESMDIAPSFLDMDKSYVHEDMIEKIQSISLLLENTLSGLQKISWNNLNKSSVVSSLRTSLEGMGEELDKYNRIVERLGTEIVFVQKGSHVLLHDQSIQWQVQTVIQEGLEQSQAIVDSM